MKKSMIVAALLTVGLAACDKNDDTTPVEPPALDPVPPMSTPAPAPSPMTPPSESGVPPASPTAPSQTN